MAFTPPLARNVVEVKPEAAKVIDALKETVTPLDSEGMLVGRDEGCVEGCPVGWHTGCIDGCDVGCIEGCAEGCSEG